MHLRKERRCNAVRDGSWEDTAGNLSLSSLSPFCKRRCSYLGVSAYAVSRLHHSTEAGQYREVRSTGLENEAHRMNFPYHGLLTPSKLEVLLFLHSSSLLNKALERRMLTVPQSYATDTLIGYCVQIVTKAWWKLPNLRCVEGFKTALPLYKRYNSWKICFVVFFEYTNGFVILWELLTLRNIYKPVKREDSVDPPVQMDSYVHAVPNVTYQMFDRLEFYPLSYELFNYWESRSELENLRSRVNALPLVFAGLPEQLSAALDIIPPGISRQKILPLDKDGNDVSSTEKYRAHPFLTLSNHNILKAKVACTKPQKGLHWKGTTSCLPKVANRESSVNLTQCCNRWSLVCARKMLSKKKRW